jgi:hypothetical protein
MRFRLVGSGRGRMMSGQGSIPFIEHIESHEDESFDG